MGTQTITAGELLREARVAAGLTQDQLVSALAEDGYSYTRQAVSLWESSHPPAWLLPWLERRIGLDPLAVLMAMGGRR